VKSRCAVECIADFGLHSLSLWMDAKSSARVEENSGYAHCSLSTIDRVAGGIHWKLLSQWCPCISVSHSFSAQTAKYTPGHSARSMDKRQSALLPLNRTESPIEPGSAVPGDRTEALLFIVQPPMLQFVMGSHLSPRLSLSFPFDRHQAAYLHVHRGFGFPSSASLSPISLRISTTRMSADPRSVMHHFLRLGASLSVIYHWARGHDFPFWASNVKPGTSSPNRMMTVNTLSVPIACVYM